MNDRSQRHRDAEGIHDKAADTHERAATYWDELGDEERAELERDLAEHERAGAGLERRWGELRRRRDAEREGQSPPSNT